MKKQDVITFRKKDDDKYWRLHFIRHYQNAEINNEVFCFEKIKSLEHLCKGDALNTWLGVKTHQ